MLRPFDGKNAWSSMESNYYNCLETQAKHHYTEKLMSVDLMIPFCPKTTADSMTA